MATTWLSGVSFKVLGPGRHSVLLGAECFGEVRRGTNGRWDLYYHDGTFVSEGHSRPAAVLAGASIPRNTAAWSELQAFRICQMARMRSQEVRVA